MDLKSLRYFVAVIEAGSLSRAATTQYVAQPALTAQIKQLEAELGAQLLERSHAGVSPTAIGMQLYQEALRLIAEADAIKLRIGKLSGKPEGTVTVAFPAMLAPTLLGQLLLTVHARFPRVVVRVIDEASLGTLSAVRDGRADFGLLVDPPAIGGLMRHAVARESIYLTGTDPRGAAREKLAKTSAQARGRRAREPKPSAAPTIRFVDVATLPLVLQSRSYSVRRAAQAAAKAAGVRLNVVHEHDSLNALRAVARVGRFFTLSPACAAFRDGIDGAYRGFRARVVEPEMHRHYAISWLQGRHLSTATREVIQITRSEIALAIAEGRWIAESLDDLTGNQSF